MQKYRKRSASLYIPYCSVPARHVTNDHISVVPTVP